MKTTISGRVVVGRDSVTGRFIPVHKAKKRKKSAEVERLRVVRLKDGRYACQRP